MIVDPLFKIIRHSRIQYIALTMKYVYVIHIKQPFDAA